MSQPQIRSNRKNAQKTNRKLNLEIVRVYKKGESCRHSPPIRDNINRNEEDKEDREEDKQRSSFGLIKIEQASQRLFPSFNSWTHKKHPIIIV